MTRRPRSRKEIVSDLYNNEKEYETARYGRSRILLERKRLLEELDKAWKN